MNNKFSMKMIVQCHECATALEFIIVSKVSRGNGDMFQISVSSCPFCEELRINKSKSKKEVSLKKMVAMRLAEIETDERLKEPPATVTVNAPLALVQAHLEATRSTLKWVLTIDGD